MDIADWQLWATTQAKNYDGWESAYPNWDALIEWTKAQALEQPEAQTTVELVEFILKISAETEDLVYFLRENSSVFKRLIQKLSNSNIPQVERQIKKALDMDENNSSLNADNHVNWDLQSKHLGEKAITFNVSCITSEELIPATNRKLVESIKISPNTYIHDFGQKLGNYIDENDQRLESSIGVIHKSTKGLLHVCVFPNVSYLSQNSLIKNWQLWSTTQAKNYDGWESAYPGWDELIETVQEQALAEPEKQETLELTEFALSISDETEDLIPFFKNHSVKLLPLIEKLISSDDYKVRWQIAEILNLQNPIEEELLSKLAEDPHQYVRKRATKHISQKPEDDGIDEPDDKKED